ncbi:MAG: hypothetical protein GH150_00210 [Hadesarchaea archaeon]|nr:hypothetical protein [Hadesarchaea archaeon]
MTKEPTHMRISVEFKESAQPLKPYGYTWIQEYKQFKDLEQGEWFEFQQESLIKDLKIKILYPPNAIATSKSVYCYTFENGEKIPFKRLEVNRDRKKKNRQYVELKLDEIEVNRILRFEFSAKPSNTLKQPQPPNAGPE